MQKRKRHTYPHTRRFALALIITMGFMLYLIFYNPYPIIAIPPYFEFLPFIYLPLTLWWLPVGFRYLRRFQVQKRVVLLMIGCIVMSSALFLGQSLYSNKSIECQENDYGYHCGYYSGCCYSSFSITTIKNLPIGISSNIQFTYGACLCTLF